MFVLFALISLFTMLVLYYLLQFVPVKPHYFYPLLAQLKKSENLSGEDQLL